MKKVVLILIGFVFLISSLFVGNPFDFSNSTIDRIAVFLVMTLILIIFFGLYRQIREIDNKALKKVNLGIMGLIAIPYFLIGLWSLMLTTSSSYPIWQDVSIYTNVEGEKVISQWRETSGSIYDYRDRRVIYEFGQLRISINCNINALSGKWQEYLINKDSISLVNFDNER
ncbi:hypothetical protein [Labilibaculum sp.]|uniref:hypothetical protein n=1 Tax=Labilibaculum sp. TaxID=2060723 RepID=UPI002AA777B5|nr:hypothetical protein [Labilibaculum sp.]